MTRSTDQTTDATVKAITKPIGGVSVTRRLTVDLGIERQAAVRSLARSTLRHDVATLPIPDDAAGKFGPHGHSTLDVDRGRIYQRVSVDRFTQQTGRAYVLAWRLTDLSWLRLRVLTGSRKHFLTCAGTYTSVCCLRPDVPDALTALAALDAGDLATVETLIGHWADDIRQAIESRSRQAQTFYRRLLDQVLTVDQKESP